MQILPLCLTAVMGGFVAHLAATLARGQPLLRCSYYLVGAASATFAAAISQNVPALHNKLLALGVLVPALALSLYQGICRMLVVRRRRVLRQPRRSFEPK